MPSASAVSNSSFHGKFASDDKVNKMEITQQVSVNRNEGLLGNNADKNPNFILQRKILNENTISNSIISTFSVGSLGEQILALTRLSPLISTLTRHGAYLIRHNYYFSNLYRHFLSESARLLSLHKKKFIVECSFEPARLFYKFETSQLE